MTDTERLTALPMQDGPNVRKLSAPDATSVTLVHVPKDPPGVGEEVWHVPTRVVRAIAAQGVRVGDPPPPADGLRAALEAVVAAWDAPDYSNRSEHFLVMGDAMKEARAALAASPAPTLETPERHALRTYDAGHQALHRRGGLRDCPICAAIEADKLAKAEP